jgi:ring-1,2-phenylacetyl-CoA epoxidase subunit PaaD
MVSPARALRCDVSLRDRIREVLSTVLDPEIPAVSVLDLGIVRAIKVEGDPVVEITPTYTGCPATLAIERAIRAALDGAGFADVALRTTISPPWTTDWISDAGREKLRAYGIAPPPRGSAASSLNDEPAECPRCASLDTEEISRFGSTPCKALWRCRACAEPFDRFKCH